MQRIVLGFVLGLPLMAADVTVALGAPAATTASMPVENPDTHFYQRAAEANLAEIDGGMLAQQRSESPAVKRFGQMMVKDHTVANHTLRDLATANHVDLPEQPNAEQRARRATLQQLTGNAFDKAYIEGQILAHKDAIALFKEESASGDDIAARQFATDSLPTLQSHLSALMAMPTPAAADTAAAPQGVAPPSPTQPAPNPTPSTPSPP